MAGTLNKVMLIGYLGDEVKIHYFEGGSCVARFPLATHELYTDKQSGEKITHTEWHSMVVKNKLAEICEKHLKKGDKIYCEGKIKTRVRELEGIRKSITEIHIVDISFLSHKSNELSSKVKKSEELIDPENIINELPF